MEYRGYHAYVRYSEEDRLFVGEVIGINDTLGFHGSTVDELEQMFHQSIDNYLAMCEEFGKKPLEFIAVPFHSPDPFPLPVFYGTASV